MVRAAHKARLVPSQIETNRHGPVTRFANHIVAQAIVVFGIDLGESEALGLQYILRHSAIRANRLRKEEEIRLTRFKPLLHARQGQLPP